MHDHCERESSLNCCPHPLSRLITHIDTYDDMQLQRGPCRATQNAGRFDYPPTAPHVSMEMVQVLHPLGRRLPTKYHTI